MISCATKAQHLATTCRWKTNAKGVVHSLTIRKSKFKHKGNQQRDPASRYFILHLPLCVFAETKLVEELRGAFADNARSKRAIFECDHLRFELPNEIIIMWSRRFTVVVNLSHSYLQAFVLTVLYCGCYRALNLNTYPFDRFARLAEFRGLTILKLYDTRWNLRLKIYQGPLEVWCCRARLNKTSWM